jgi:phage terminase small subunit
MAKLTLRRKKFADEWLISGNATAAAKKAGYSEKTAKSQGQRLLTNADLQAYIQKKMLKSLEKLEITEERILQEIAAIGFFDIFEATDQFSFKPIKTADKLKALELLAKKFKMFADTVDHTHKMVGPAKITFGDNGKEDQ